MKTHTEYLMFNTKNKTEFLNITSEVETTVEKSGVKEGLVLVNPMHITSAIYVNDAESGLIQDFKEWTEKGTDIIEKQICELLKNKIGK